MKKFIKIFLMILVLFLSFTISTKVSADTGPKPYVDITIEGDTKGMYMTLLSNIPSTGPHSVYDENEYNKNTNPINLKFVNYKDSDNFYYLQFYTSIENHKFRWGYYPPSTFKILIYDSINDSFITDNKIYKKQEFGSLYKLKLNDDVINVINEEHIAYGEERIQIADDVFEVSKENTIGKHILGFFIRLVICLGIEIIIALLFRFKKFELIPILIVNIVTQIALNISLSIDIYNKGFVPFLSFLTFNYLLMELGILIVEFLAYFIIFKKLKFYKEKNISSIRILIYTLVANITSLGLGFVIISILQNMNILV